MVERHLRGLIFDFDGTLADTLPLCIQAFRQAIEPLANRTFTDVEITDTFGPSEEGTIQSLIPGYYQQGISDYLRHYERMHEQCPAPFAGITELLDEALSQGIRLGLVTGKGPHSTAISLNYFALSNYFEYIETGWVHGPRKVDGIRLILDQWTDLSPNQVWYVGDTPSDILAAREAGILAIGAAWAPATNAERLAALQPNELFTSVPELIQWIRRITDK